MDSHSLRMIRLPGRGIPFALPIPIVGQHEERIEGGRFSSEEKALANKEKSEGSLIYVRGITPDIANDELVQWMEGEKLGGGKIKSLEIDRDKETALIQYVHAADAQRMLSNGIIRMNGKELSLHSWRTNTDSETDEATASKDPDTTQLSDINMVQVMNIPRITEHYLKLVFEKESHGKVADVTMCETALAARVKFEQERDAARLLQKGSIHIEGRSCKVIPLYTEVHERIEGSLAVKVHGLTKEITEERLTLFFSNRRRSGGYDLHSVLMLPNDQTAVIAFKCADAVKSILGMQHKGCLQLKNAKLSVEEMKPLPPPPYISGPTEPKKLIMIEAPAVNKKELEQFLSNNMDMSSNEHAANNPVSITQLLYGYKNGVLLIEFKNIPDYPAMLTICTTLPLKDRMTSLQKVACTTMIQVRSQATLEAEDLVLYFESEKGGGSDIIGEVQLCHQDHCAVIDFGDSKVVEAILKKKHTVCGKNVTVESFYPAFGTWPPNYDPCEPWQTTPRPFDFKVQDPLIVELLFAKSKALDRLNEFAKMSSFQVSLISGNDAVLHVSYANNGEGVVPEQREWEDMAYDQLSQFIHSVTVKRFAIIAECFSAVCDKAAKLIQDDHCILLKQVEDASVLVVVGLKPEVDKISVSLEQFIHKTKEEFMLYTNSASGKMQLKSHEIMIIQAQNCIVELKAKFPKLEIQLEKSSLSFKGLSEEISDAKLFLYENVLHRIKHLQHRLSERTVKFLQLPDVTSFVMSKCQKANACIAFEYDDAQVTLYAMSEGELKSGINILEQDIVNKTIPLDENNLPVLRHPAWSAMKENLTKVHNCKMLIEEDRAGRAIHLVTLCAFSNVILEDIHNTLSEFTVLKQCYDLHAPVKELLSRFHQDKVDKITTNLKSLAKIQPTENGYVFEGNKHGIQSAVGAFDALREQVVSRTHAIEQPLMKYSLRSAAGKADIKLLEETCKVVCVDGNAIDSRHSSKLLPQSGAKSLYSITVIQTRIMVLTGDITRYPVDAIVNAANGDLKHSGGLAAAIVKAGGDEIQNECDKYMARNAMLLPGDVYVSKPGRLPCKILIHAVGPRWMGGTSGEIAELFEAVTRSLEETEKAGLQSIAIPVISSGIFGFPVDKATKTICEAVIEFLKTHPTTSITTVCLMDNDPIRGQSLVHSLQKSVPQPVIPKVTAPISKPQSLGGKIKAFFLGAPSKGTSGVDKLITPEGISISIKKGCLEQEQVDALVNTTNKDFQLNAAGVSGAILAAAGSVIQQEITVNMPANVSAGTILRTSGGNLPVKSIFHGFLGQWNDGKHLRRFISNALKAAHQAGYTSIAFPAIGTGNLKYDPKMVAKIMVEETLKFSSAVQPTTLKEVRIVLFPSDTATLQAFEEYWQSHSQRNSSSKAGSTSRRIHKEEVVSPQSTSQLYSIIQDTSQMLAVQIGAVTVGFKIGDITKERSEVIMNNTDYRFGTGGAISKAIAKAGGSEIKTECDDILSQCGVLADIALTNAGNLPCWKIIHVNVTSGIEWTKLLLMAFEDLEKNKMKSLSMPTLGAGNLGKKPKSVCQAILKAANTFALEKNPKYLININVVVYDKDVFKHYKSFVQAVFSGRIPGILPQITESSNDAPLMYTIFALKQAAIDDFITKLEAFFKQKIMKHVLDDPEDQDIIAMLQARHIMMIKALEKECSSRITIYQGSRLNRIAVEAETKNMTQCITQIKKILHHIHSEYMEEQNATLIYNQVRWQFAELEDFTDYPPEINYVIEKAYANKEKTATWKEEDGDVVVYFDKMCERRNNNSNTDAKVRRHLPNAPGGSLVPLPTNWSPMKPQQQHIRVMLNTNDSEYQKVAQNFTVGNIITIERIQNPTLYQMYQIRKQQMDKVNQSMNNEMKLYHGTSEQSVQNINNHGFNRSYCGKHGTAIGNGVYFAVNPAYSAKPTYAQPNTVGEKYIYQAKVLVGNSCLGAGGMVEPPYINGSSGIRYDSVHDNAKAMYVVFHDAQAYPEYLIKFR